MLVTLCRLYMIVAAVALLILGLIKFTDHDTLLLAVLGHELFKSRVAAAVSWIVPAIEMILGAGSILALTTSVRSSAVLAVMVATFFAMMTVYTAVLWIRPPSVPVSCGCLPNAPPVESWMRPTIRNGVLTSITAMVASIMIGASEPHHSKAE